MNPYKKAPYATTAPDVLELLLDENYDPRNHTGKHIHGVTVCTLTEQNEQLLQKMFVDAHKNYSATSLPLF